MNPFLLVLLAIISPLVLFVVLFTPIYAGLFGAAYLIYDKPNAVNPMAAHMDDVFYMVNAYTALFNNWLEHMKAADLLHYTAPLLVLPLAGIFLALWLTANVARRLKNIFHIGVGM